MLYQELARVVELQRPDVVALVGDLLDATLSRWLQLTSEECGEFLSQLSCQDTIFVRGNHEDCAWWEFAATWNKTGRK